jgi:hypothetical protein
MHISSPAMGVGVSKIVALGIGGLCMALNRARLISWINYWYAGLIIWNLCVLLSASTLLKH